MIRILNGHTIHNLLTNIIEIETMGDTQMTNEINDAPAFKNVIDVQATDITPAADPIRIVDIRDFLREEIAGLSTMLESTSADTDNLSKALENIYRRQQIIGALSALTNLSEALRRGDENGGVINV